MKRIKIIGLTGQSGSGKSTAAEYFSQRNINVVNADMLVRELYADYSPCVRTIAAAFGSDILDENRQIIRPLLAQRAFSSKENTALLSSIVHPFVMSMFISRAKQTFANGEEYIVYDAPQLFESNADAICDVIVSVVADREVRIKRICQRDKITRKVAEMRVNAQLSEEFFRKNSDYVLENNSDLAALKQSLEQLYGEIILNGDK